MKRAEKDLEKSLKKILRGESVDAARVVAAWTELGEAGDRLVASTWSRSGGGQVFADWASGVPGTRPFLESLIRSAGLSATAMERLVAAGVEKPTQDAPSLRSLWICEVAGAPDSGDWVRARDMMLSLPGIFEGTVSLMEMAPSQYFVEFLAQFLQETLSQEQDHRVRKALYHMKQQGLAAEQEKRSSVQETEWFAFAENRLPLWQLVLCFRFHSAFSGAGDLYILRILEGREFAPPEQKANLHITHSEFLKLANRYAEQIQRETGAPLTFHPVTAESAHYLLKETRHALEGRPGCEALDTFLRFLKAGDGRMLLEGEAPSKEGSDAALLGDDYFRHWMLDPEALQEYTSQVRNMEQGPIVLVGSSLLDQKRAAAREAIRKYFDESRRRLWSVAFRKAAFFLGRAQAAKEALRISGLFADPSIPVESIEAVQLLFDRSVQYVQRLEQERAKEEKQTSLIVTPDEFARSQRNRGQS